MADESIEFVLAFAVPMFNGRGMGVHDGRVVPRRSAIRKRMLLARGCGEDRGRGGDFHELRTCEFGFCQFLLEDGEACTFTAPPFLESMHGPKPTGIAGMWA